MLPAATLSQSRETGGQQLQLEKMSYVDMKFSWQTEEKCCEVEFLLLSQHCDFGLSYILIFFIFFLFDGNLKI